MTKPIPYTNFKEDQTLHGPVKLFGHYMDPQGVDKML